VTGHRASRVVAVVLGGTAVALAIGVAFFTNARAHSRSDAIFSFSDLIQQVSPGIAFLATGALLATRRPGNRIGWLCLAIGVVGSVGWAAEQYAAHVLVIDPGSGPAGLAIAITTEAAFAPIFFLLVLLVVLFPDGRLPSPRWRWLPVTASVTFLGLWVLGSSASLAAPFTGVENPLDSEMSARYAPLVVVPVVLGAVSVVIGAFAAVVVRFRRSSGDERAQLKWLVYAATVLPVGLISHAIVEILAPDALGTVELLFSLGVLAIPAAITVAVLKYRLYEIDRVISRTLTYGLVSVLLVGTYGGLVLVGQALFSSLAGGSNLAIAVSTLVVAALFLPLRARIQRVVDRRFYRGRYDAQWTLEAFGVRVREEVDLATLSADLRGVVKETMQPTAVTLWLRRGVQ
jgi:hypothetical protein